MTRARGFTVIEFLILAALVAIFALAMAAQMNAPRVGDTRCIAGTTYVVTEVKNTQPEIEQMRDQDGRAVSCNN